VLEVYTGARLTLRNLAIIEGNAPLGGGGIFNYFGATLIVADSSFSGNHAGAPGSGALGGAIANWGTAVVADSAFEQNSATYLGGAISNTSGATLSVINSTFSENTAEGGGAIANGTTVTVTNSVFTGNTASGGGGAIASSHGELTVTNSAFTANSANLGGAIAMYADLATVAGSAFLGNSATSAGGGISNYTEMYQFGGTLDVANSTFAANAAPSGSGLFNYGLATLTNATFSANEGGGAGIFNGAGVHGTTLTLHNTIVANSAVVNCLNNGSLVDGGGNLSWPDATCPGLNADPLLGPLQGNGGPTQTQALLAGSPALDAAALANCPATDQRGVSRPQGPGCDIGAYEAGVEFTSPNITINTPAEGAVYFVGQAVTADYACQDDTGGSGLVACVGTVPNGEPINIGSVGAASFTVNAADNAGNVASLTHSYRVVYEFSGLFQPVDDRPTLNVVRAGLGIPVRFSLSGDRGLTIFAAGYPASVKIPCPSGAPEDAIEQTAKVSSSSLAYDALSDTYTYRWKSDTAWAGACRQLTLRLNDGTERVADFKFVR
jgi:predicted outer membrane repeat protein